MEYIFPTVELDSSTVGGILCLFPHDGEMSSRKSRGTRPAADISCACSKGYRPIYLLHRMQSGCVGGQNIFARDLYAKYIWEYCTILGVETPKKKILVQAEVLKVVAEEYAENSTG